MIVYSNSTQRVFMLSLWGSKSQQSRCQRNKTPIRKRLSNWMSKSLSRESARKKTRETQWRDPLTGRRPRRMTPSCKSLKSWCSKRSTSKKKSRPRRRQRRPRRYLRDRSSPDSPKWASLSKTSSLECSSPCSKEPSCLCLGYLWERFCLSCKATTQLTQKRSSTKLTWSLSGCS